MSSPATAAADVVVPALSPIRTAAAAPSRTSSTPAPANDAKPLTVAKEEAGKEAGAEAEAEPTTPTSEESKLRTPTECPPAPRKPARTTTVKRKPASSSSSAPLVFFPVQPDLSAVFRSLPPKKRIRAG
ncbi:hypothetical protein ABZP36_030718 [Zizania latifolia]